MRLTTRILFGLAGFLTLAAAVYWLMASGRHTRDPEGAGLMLIGAVAFGYMGLVLRAARRRAERAAALETSAEPADLTMVHVPPTIWPFVLSIAGVTLVVGLVVATRVLLPVAVALLIASVVGWYVEVGRAHRHARDR
jgi:hypothetical protein